MSLKNPTVTIITVYLNNETGLRETVKSVLDQTYPQIEYIVIDGESSDGSRAFIESQQARIAVWKSEKDSGIYQAEHA